MFKDIGYKRGDPHEEEVRRYIAKLKNLGVDIRHENHQLIVNSVRKVKVDNTGVIVENFK